MLTLKQLYETVLLELPAYKRKGFDKLLKSKEQALSLLKTYQESGNKYLFVQFAQVPKLGINPKSKYDTPIGIYSYPAHLYKPEKLLAGKVPFARRTTLFSVLYRQGSTQR